MKRLHSVQRQLRHAEAKQAELDDDNALLRQQLTDVQTSADETASKLESAVEHLTAKLRASEQSLQQLKVRPRIN